MNSSLAISAGEAERRLIADIVAKIKACGTTLEAATVESINLGRQAGLLLRNQIGREHAQKERIQSWIRLHADELGGLNTDLAHTFLRMAALMKAPITTLQQAEDTRQLLFQGMGLLASPHREEQQASVPPASVEIYINRIGKLRVEFEHAIETEPIGKWPYARKAVLASALKPLVKLYEELGIEE